MSESLWNQDYPAKPLPFGISVALHGVVLGMVWMAPSMPDAIRRAAEPGRAIEPKRTRLVWYQFKRQLPPVTPQQRIGEGKRPRGLERTLQQPIIAQAPKPVSREQFIWHEAPKLRIEEDLRSPNLIARAPRPPPRTFSPPPAAKPLAAEGVPLEAPRIDLAQPALPVATGLPGAVSRPKPRDFVPPPARGAGQGMAGDSPALEITAAPDLGGNLTAQASLAIVGLRPTDRLEGPPPEGSRPGQLSRASEVGEPSSGPGVAAGTRVPDLMIGASKNPRGPGREGKSPDQLIYQETLAGGARSALSAPLRPGARFVPRPIEAHFRDRIVYTIVLPMPQLPDYWGDWVIWFGELQALPGTLPRVQAPTPARKVDAAGSGQSRIEGRVMLSAVIRKDGKLEAVTVLSGKETLHRSAVEDLVKWDFRPAVRDGAPVDVEVVFDIPFRLAAR